MEPGGLPSSCLRNVAVGDAIWVTASTYDASCREWAREVSEADIETHQNAGPRRRHPET